MGHKLGSMTQPLQKLPTVVPASIDRATMADFFQGRVVVTQSRRKALPREATMGPLVYAEVTKLIDTGMKKSEAFEVVAADLLDKNASDEDVVKKARSVATTFYRLQRLAADNEGEVPAPKRRGRPPKAKTDEVSPVAGADAPKRRGRPPGSKNKPKDETPVAVAVHNGDGHGDDVMQALGQAKAAIDAAIERQRAESAELAELREFKDRVGSILG